MKLAVVGSGPAAIGVLAAIRAKMPDASISVFDVNACRKTNFSMEASTCPPPAQFERDLIKYIRTNHAFSFPPPKSEFGLVAPKYKVNGIPRIWRSEFRGGLSNLWGGSVLPFTDRELLEWPISAAELEPYYRRIANLIGISGEQDNLNTYYREDFANRPPIKLSEVLKKLRSTISKTASSDDYKLIAGVARLALETRPEKENCCTFGGYCMTGCTRRAIYNANNNMQIFEDSFRKFEYISAKVEAIDLEKRKIVIGSNTSLTETSKFDKVYLCAGCAGTTEILMRSLGIPSGPILLDNTIHTFPIIYTGDCGPDDSSSLALTNLLICVIPQNSNRPMIQIQVYRTVNYYWRYYLPNKFWPVAQPIGDQLARRLYWARLYLHSDHSAAYAPVLRADNSMAFNLVREAQSTKLVRTVIRKIRQALTGSGFHLPMIPTIRHKTSSHYSGTFPYGGEYLGKGASGEIASGIYVSDSTVFPDSPSGSPTFTIMANAFRTADSSLDD